MTVKEFRQFLLYGDEVKLMFGHTVLFRGKVEDLPGCIYKDCEVKSVTPSWTDNSLHIYLANLMVPSK